MAELGSGSATDLQHVHRAGAAPALAPRRAAVEGAYPAPEPDASGPERAPEREFRADLAVGVERLVRERRATGRADAGAGRAAGSDAPVSHQVCPGAGHLLHARR